MHASRRTAVAGALLLAGAAGRARAQGATYEQLESFSYLLNEVQLNYVRSVGTSQLVRAAIEGMLHSLDPHSRFVSHEDNDLWVGWEGGRVAGAGIALEDEDGRPTVAAVQAGSPAAAVGVLPGDRVRALDGASVSGISASDLQFRLLGPRGRVVRLLLERGPRYQPDTLTVAVTDDYLKPQSVSDARTLAPGVGYVRLAEFDVGAAKEVRDAAHRVLSGPRPRTLVLDLRGDPGGSLGSLVEVASLFFPKGVLIFRTQGRRQEMDSSYVTNGDGDLADTRLVVLIDAYTASAAEALTGALQDHDRALVLGRRSFGKALVQRLYELPPFGDAVWLTVAYMYTPSGRLIQRRFEGLSLPQYYELAGRGGAPEDTLATYKTDSGRTVRGGGGIEPDSTLPAAAAAPLWWSVAVDSNLVDVVADSVAGAMATDPRPREAWLDATAEWRERLLAPFLARVRGRLGAIVPPDSAQAGRIAELLAARVAEVRWGADAALELGIHNDPDVRAALARILAGRAAPGR